MDVSTQTAPHAGQSPTAREPRWWRLLELWLARPSEEQECSQAHPQSGGMVGVPAKVDRSEVCLTIIPHLFLTN